MRKRRLTERQVNQLPAAATTVSRATVATAKLGTTSPNTNTGIDTAAASRKNNTLSATADVRSDPRAPDTTASNRTVFVSSTAWP